MSESAQPSTPADRDRARSRLRTLTRGNDRRGDRRDRRHRGRGGPRPSRRRLGDVDQDPELSGRHDRGPGRCRHDRRVGHRILFILAIDHIDHSSDQELLVGHRDIGRDIVTPPVEVPERSLTTRSFRAIGTTATVVVQDPGHADEAERLLADELAAIDVACSRFRADSEQNAAPACRCRPSGSRWAGCSSTPSRWACAVARRTAGAVDPTIGNAIAMLGYDVDLDEVLARPPAPPRALGLVAGYQHVQLDWPVTARSASPASASTSARRPRRSAADRAAARIAEERGFGGCS